MDEMKFKKWNMKCNYSKCNKTVENNSGYCNEHLHMIDSNDYGIIQCWNCNRLVRFFYKKYDLKLRDHKYTFCDRCRSCGGTLQDENIVFIHPDKKEE